MMHRLRHLLLLAIPLWLILVSTGRSSAQYGPFYGANMILVGTSYADKEAHQLISQVLTQETINHAIDNGLVTFQVVATSPATGKELLYDCSMRVQAGLVKLTGRLRNEQAGTSQARLTEAGFIPIAYTKERTSHQRLGFTYLDEVAKKVQSALQGVIIYKSE